MTTGVYSNLYYPTRWVPLKRRGLGWQRCNELYEEHRCIASCGLAYGKTLEIVLDIKGCNLNCKYCWGWKMRYLSEDIRKTPQQVVEDILCRAHHVINDRIVAKSKYAIGVIRITGNEPTLQWKHLIEILRLSGDEEFLVKISEKRDFDDKAVKAILNSKVIVETNGVLIGMGKINFSDLLDVEKEIDFDVSFKGVNPDQFEWLSDMPKRYFDYQVKGFVSLFDFAESNCENINVNPVLGINHSPNYCVWRRGKKYVMDVEIIDRHGNKLNFEDFSRNFEEEVLSRRDLRFDEAPFREYFGINKDRTRQVIAVVYRGKRYLHVLPSEIPEIVDSEQFSKGSNK